MFFEDLLEVPKKLPKKGIVGMDLRRTARTGRAGVRRKVDLVAWLLNV